MPDDPEGLVVFGAGFVSALIWRSAGMAEDALSLLLGDNFCLSCSEDTVGARAEATDDAAVSAPATGFAREPPEGAVAVLGKGATTSGSALGEGPSAESLGDLRVCAGGSERSKVGFGDS